MLDNFYEDHNLLMVVPQPRVHISVAAVRDTRFGLFPVRSPLLGKSRFLSVPVGTEMFQFPTFATRNYAFTPG